MLISSYKIIPYILERITRSDIVLATKTFVISNKLRNVTMLIEMQLQIRRHKDEHTEKEENSSNIRSKSYLTFQDQD